MTTDDKEVARPSHSMALVEHHKYDSLKERRTAIRYQLAWRYLKLDEAYSCEPAAQF
jgi:hypothetical protein